MKSFLCTDGFVSKTISANTAPEAAESYAIVSCTVTVTEVDSDDNAIGEAEEIKIEVAE